MPTPSELIDAFCDQVWLQDGLAQSSLSSYRRDLGQWAAWLERRGSGLLQAQRTDVEAFLAERTRRIPLGRRIDCDVVAASVVWLALDAPDYITAERLNVSGGLDKD